MVLDEAYFSASATILAPDLIGKVLCRSWNGHVERRRILETECYFGEADTACHAHKGKTPRTEIMYRAGGRAYVYLCYGIHHLLNLTTGPEGHPEAVLIRGVEGAIGPGRLTKLLQINQGLNTQLLLPQYGLWVEDDGISMESIALPRVGIGYASDEDQARLWRYVAIKS
jgi:DNA-3-methyladenine glycosylase